jgi:hypothetical protein
MPAVARNVDRKASGADSAARSRLPSKTRLHELCMLESIPAIGAIDQSIKYLVECI